MPRCDFGTSYYPPCNRAFTLRMLNPTSYADKHTSPFDREIQPLQKSFTANPVIEDPPKVTDGPSDINQTTAQQRESLSKEVPSLSPTSSVTSLSEMELYDIDEDNYEGKSRNYRQTKKDSPISDNKGLVRSYSSVDGFNDYFDRKAITRSSMPAKEIKAATNDQNEYQETEKRNGSSLRRSQSLKGNRPKCLQNVSPGRGKEINGFIEQKSSTVKVRVVATKSSQLRAKVIESKQKQKQRDTGDEQKRIVKSSLQRNARSSTFHVKSRSQNDADEFLYSESDSSSTIFSEAENYNPRCNSRAKQNRMNGHSRSLGRQNRRESPLRYSEPSTPSPKLNIDSKHLNAVTSAIPKTDTFSKKLSEVCRLISERHPGDFQILETLTEMQSAYEERNKLVTCTLSGLREHVRTLERKCANAPNIPTLVIPLMRATNAFQTQLQSIMDAHHNPGKDQSTQHPETISGLEEIANEANLIANQIEDLKISSSPDYTSINGHHSPKAPSNGTIDNRDDSGNSDKENQCNGHTENSAHSTV